MYWRRRQRWRMAIWTLGLVLVAVSLWRTYLGFTPAILALAEAQARATAAAWVNQIIKSELSRGLTYEDLIRVSRDESGRVTLLEADTSRIQSMAARAVRLLEEQLASLPNGRLDLRLPVGSATGIPALSGLGPKIVVRALPVGNVSATPRSQFKSGGINQTLHAISLDIAVRLRIVAPLLQTEVTVVEPVPLVEAVIVGPVPQWLTPWDWGPTGGGSGP